MKKINNLIIATIILFINNAFAVDGDGSGTPKSNITNNTININYVDGDGSGTPSKSKLSCITVKVDGDGSGTPAYATMCTKKKI